MFVKNKIVVNCNYKVFRRKFKLIKKIIKIIKIIIKAPPNVEKM